MLLATVLLAGSTAVVGSAPASARATVVANADIVAKARSYKLGTHGGQCKVFAEAVVNAVLAAHGQSKRVGGYGTPGGAYYGAWAQGGGKLVPAAQAAPGDVIQIVSSAHKTADFPPGGLHSAIIVALTSKPGVFVVRDSNYGNDELIREHQLNPVWYASSRGSAVYYWRFGTTAKVSASKGSVDKAVSTSVHTTKLYGWAYDPDAPAKSIKVMITRDGQRIRTIKAGGTSTALDSAQGITGKHGYALALTNQPSGRHHYCVRPIGIAGTGPNGRSTCRWVLVDAKAPPAHRTATWHGSTVKAGTSVRTGTVINGGAYRLTLQTDGNLVLRAASSGRVLWQSKTADAGVARLTVRKDGNIVLADTEGHVDWQTGARSTGARLVVRPTGNLVAYRRSGTVLWQTHTAP